MGSIVVIGNFDGVHLGHQAVLAALARLARNRQLEPKVLSFEPHPAVTLGRNAPSLLTTLARKRELIEQHCPGVELVVREFTVAFAQQSPAQFVQRVLIEQLAADVVMVGLNFRFGRDRSGGIGELEGFGQQHGFETMAEPLVSDEHGPWSSTRVRGLIANGEMAAAASILGRSHMLTGLVERGAQRGRQLGFPTCNIANAPEALPPNGVYAVLVDHLVGGSYRSLGKGVANIGVRPTVSPAAQKPLLEVHLFDLEQDLYGAELRVHFVARLREEQRFASLEELRTQISKDGEQARDLLANFEPDDVNSPWA